jgi:formate/nitrite transporter FocA (FNT family)
MENSSNQDMNKVFEQLANIKMVEPSNNLYVKTINRMQRQSIIPLFWARVVACLFIAFISAEYFMVSKYKKHNHADISVVIYQTNNFSYNE